MMKTVAQSTSYVLFLALKKKSDDMTAFVVRKESVREAKKTMMGGLSVFNNRETSNICEDLVRVLSWGREQKHLS